MEIKRIKKRIITPEFSILEAMKKMDEIKVKILFVFTANKFEAILTLGDIQRAIIKGLPLTERVINILDRNKIYADVSDSFNSIKNKMKAMRAELMPVLQDGELVEVYTWEDMFGTIQRPQKELINLPVVIMAGGKGTRLKPLTNIMPKPLIPINDKTILEAIMDQFESIGCRKFYMSVHYKSDMIKYYLGQLKHKYDIEFFQEEKPFGTIGSVALLKGKITTPFFVSNCDSISEIDHRDVYNYHVRNNNDMTIVTMVKSIKIPYGVIETGQDGLMTVLKEKPEEAFQVNTGVYILNPGLIDEIPQGEVFHMTQLMQKVQSRGGRVGCFPVSEQSWHDVGEWAEYLRMINKSLFHKHPF